MPATSILSTLLNAVAAEVNETGRNSCLHEADTVVGGHSKTRYMCQVLADKFYRRREGKFLLLSLYRVDSNIF